MRPRKIELETITEYNNRINSLEIYSVDDIKQRVKHWFDPDSMRFFNSRIAHELFYGTELIYFISSEKFKSESPRLFTVRSFNPNTNQINNASDFQEFDTKGKAVSRARALIRDQWEQQLGHEVKV